MKQYTAENYLKAHRRHSGLSQRELGILLGYRCPGQISRHERSASVPTLAMALAYELVFRVPVAKIFVGMRDTIERNVEKRLQQMKGALENRNADDRDANLVAQKLVWMGARRTQS